MSTGGFFKKTFTVNAHFWKINVNIYKHTTKLVALFCGIAFTAMDMYDTTLDLFFFFLRQKQTHNANKCRLDGQLTAFWKSATVSLCLSLSHSVLENGNVLSDQPCHFCMPTSKPSKPKSLLNCIRNSRMKGDVCLSCQAHKRLQASNLCFTSSFLISWIWYGLKH